jgi:hypothetical protein
MNYDGYFSGFRGFAGGVSFFGQSLLNGKAVKA